MILVFIVFKGFYWFLKVTLFLKVQIYKIV